MLKIMPAALYPLLAAVLLIFTAEVPLSRQVSGAPLSGEPKFRFRHHLVDTELTGEGFGQTALADLTGDGRSEFIMGRRNGELYAYQFHAPDRWTRYCIGTESPSDVGLAVVDVDRDGRPDLVSGACTPLISTASPPRVSVTRACSPPRRSVPRAALRS